MTTPTEGPCKEPKYQTSNQGATIGQQNVGDVNIRYNFYGERSETIMASLDSKEWSPYRNELANTTRNITVTQSQNSTSLPNDPVDFTAYNGNYWKKRKNYSFGELLRALWKDEVDLEFEFGFDFVHRKIIYIFHSIGIDERDFVALYEVCKCKGFSFENLKALCLPVDIQNFSEKNQHKFVELIRSLNFNGYLDIFGVINEKGFDVSVGNTFYWDHTDNFPRIFDGIWFNPSIQRKEITFICSEVEGDPSTINFDDYSTIFDTLKKLYDKKDYVTIEYILDLTKRKMSTTWTLMVTEALKKAQ
jgi:hypothetical protein